MTIRHLNVFLAVCNRGSITKAAEELHIAQPSVTQTIKELEKYYDVVLFNRINQRLVLTDLGKEALIRAQEVLSAFDNFEGLMKQSGTNITLHIGASLTYGQTLLPLLWKTIEKDFPGVRCTALVHQTLTVEQKIEEGALDFAMVEGKVSSANLTAIPFAKDTLVAVAAPDYPIGESLSFEELSTHRLLLREHGSASRDLLEHLFAARGVALHPVMESASYQALTKAAEAGLGIAILPVELIKTKIGSPLRQIRLDETVYERTSYLIFHKNKKFNPVQKAILQRCMALIKGENV